MDGMVATTKVCVCVDEDNSLTEREAREVSWFAEATPGPWMASTYGWSDAGQQQRRVAAIFSKDGQAPFRTILTVLREHGSLHAHIQVQGEYFDKDDQSPPMAAVTDALEWGRQWLRALLMDGFGWVLSDEA